MPSATLVILLPPLFKPASVNATVLLGSALVMVKPDVSNLLLPAVMLSTAMSFAKSKVRFVPLCVMAILPSVFEKSTVAFGATFSAVPPFALTFQPAFAVSFTL